MSRKLSSRSIGSRFVVDFIATALAAVLGVGSTAAAVRDHAAMPHRVRGAAGVHHQHHFARRSPAPPHIFTGEIRYAPGNSAAPFYGPGYVFVPGRGILDEDCDMPTSTCTNEYRDVQ